MISVFLQFPMVVRPELEHRMTALASFSRTLEHLHYCLCLPTSIVNLSLSENPFWSLCWRWLAVNCSAGIACKISLFYTFARKLMLQSWKIEKVFIFTCLQLGMVYNLFTFTFLLFSVIFFRSANISQQHHRTDHLSGCNSITNNFFFSFGKYYWAILSGLLFFPCPYCLIRPVR